MYFNPSRKFLSEVSYWAEKHPNVAGLALVGYNARDTARQDSDVDLSILCEYAGLLIKNHDWTSRFGNIHKIQREYFRRRKILPPDKVIW